MRTNCGMRISWIVGLCALLATSGTTLAVDLYVSTNGLDSNSGAGWGDAYATISNGVAHAGSNDTVWVSNGTYTISAQIALTNAITVRAFGGGQTVVNGGGSTRCFSLTHPGAVLDSLTISNGYVASVGGAGVYMTGGGRPELHGGQQSLCEWRPPG